MRIDGEDEDHETNACEEMLLFAIAVPRPLREYTLVHRRTRTKRVTRLHTHADVMFILYIYTQMTHVTCMYKLLHLRICMWRCSVACFCVIMKVLRELMQSDSSAT